MAMENVNMGKAIYVSIFSLMLLVLWFFTVNVPDAKEIASLYVGIGAFFLIMVFGGLTSLFKDNDESTSIPITIDKEGILGKLSSRNQFLIVLGGLIISVYLFFSISSQPSLAVVNAPKFQIVEFTIAMSFILTIICAWIEEGALISLPGSFAHYFSKRYGHSEIIGIITFIIAASFTFTIFHVAVYGFSMPVTMQSVLMYGIISAIILVVTKNIIIGSLLHSANNCGLLIASGIHIANPMLYFFGWSTIILLIGGFIYYKIGK